MLKAEMKNKIKQLLKEKKVNKAELSRSLGKDKTFINSIICGKNSFFSLEHIEKICAALNYPAHLLFVGSEYSTNPMQEKYLEKFTLLSPEQQEKVLEFIEFLNQKPKTARQKMAQTNYGLCFTCNELKALPPEKGKYCGHCGRELVLACPNCKEPIHFENDVYCRVCGAEHFPDLEA